MSKKRAFVKYTKQGKIIPGSLIITTSGGYPITGLYTEVPVDLCCDFTPFTPTTPVKSRAFVKYTKKGKIIPGSLIVTTKGGYPVDGLYFEVSSDICCNPNTGNNLIIFITQTTGVGGGCVGRANQATVYLTQACLDNPQSGCEIWLDENGTVPAPSGDYQINLPGIIPGFITVVNGVVTAVTPC